MIQLGAYIHIQEKNKVHRIKKVILRIFLSIEKEIGHLYIAGGNAKWQGHTGEQSRHFIKH